MDHRVAAPFVRASRHRAGRPLALLLAVALALLGVAACGSPQARTGSGGPTGTSATPSSPAPTAQPVVWPLTGRPATGSVDRPALAVKIENSVEARPQTGLSAADTVWEEVVEGGITRYVAVYQSQLPPQIGPVRSIRPMDPAIAGPLHGLMAYAGGIASFVDAVSAAGLQSLTPGSAQGFFRVGSRRAPHNLYATPQQLVEQADAAHRAAPPAQFAFASGDQQPTAPTTGAPTGGLQLTLSSIAHPQWTWSGSDGAWLRSEGSTPAIQADGARLRAVNVVVLRVDVVMTGYTDAAGSHVPETRLVGGGAALVATGGYTMSATWSKAGVGDPVVLTGADGAGIRLAPGTTWVELVPIGTGGVTPR